MSARSPDRRAVRAGHEPADDDARDRPSDRRRRRPPSWPATPVVVRRNAGLAALVGAAASAMAIAYLWRATQTGAGSTGCCAAVMAVAGAVFLAQPARRPHAAARRRRAGRADPARRQWRGLPWDAVDAVVVQPRRGLLHDGRLVVAPAQPRAGGRRARRPRAPAAALNQKLYGAALAVPLGLTTRVVAARPRAGRRVAALAEGRAEVVEAPAAEPRAAGRAARDVEPVGRPAPLAELAEPSSRSLSQPAAEPDPPVETSPDRPAGPPRRSVGPARTALSRRDGPPPGRDARRQPARSVSGARRVAVTTSTPTRRDGGRAGPGPSPDDEAPDGRAAGADRRPAPSRCGARRGCGPTPRRRAGAQAGAAALARDARRASRCARAAREPRAAPPGERRPGRSSRPRSAGRRPGPADRAARRPGRAAGHRRLRHRAGLRPGDRPGAGRRPHPRRAQRRRAGRPHPDPPARHRVDRGRRLRALRRRLLRPRPHPHPGAGARQGPGAAAGAVRQPLRHRPDQRPPGVRGRAGDRDDRQHAQHRRRAELGAARRRGAQPGAGVGRGAALRRRPPRGRCRTRRRCSTGPAGVDRAAGKSAAGAAPRPAAEAGAGHAGRGPGRHPGRRARRLRRGGLPADS